MAVPNCPSQHSSAITETTDNGDNDENNVQRSSSSSPLNVVVLSYEFTYRPFSGNGMLCRCAVKSLLREGCHVTVFCCRPAEEKGCGGRHDNDNHIVPPEITEEEYERLRIHAVTVPKEKGWRRVDHMSGWESFSWSSLLDEDNSSSFSESNGEGTSGASDSSSSASEFLMSLRTANVVCAVDWSGGCAWRSIPYDDIWDSDDRTENDEQVVVDYPKPPPTPPLAYLNFRVYSSGVSDPKLRQWYDEMELQVARESSVIVALSEPDKKSLEMSMSKGISSPPPVKVLLPPLRSEMEKLSSLSSEQLRVHLPSEASTALKHLPPNTPHDRVFVSCIVRLSPEKETMHFVHFIESVSSTLRYMGYTPLLAGAPSDPSYAQEVRRRLLSVAPNSVVVTSFLDSSSLAAILSRTVLNFHPCLYDAYGMTIIEAAAFGVPTALAAGGQVGASVIVGNGASFEVEMSSPANDNDNLDTINSENDGGGKLPVESIETLEHALSNPQLLESTGRQARERAIAWGEKAYGAKLHSILRQAVGRGRIACPPQEEMSE